MWPGKRFRLCSRPFLIPPIFCASECSDRFSDSLGLLSVPQGVFVTLKCYFMLARGVCVTRLFVVLVGFLLALKAVVCMPRVFLVPLIVVWCVVLVEDIFV